MLGRDPTAVRGGIGGRKKTEEERLEESGDREETVKKGVILALG
jgi:hypothetical protein